MQGKTGNRTIAGSRDRLALYRFLTVCLTKDDLYPHYTYGREFSPGQIRALWKGTVQAIRNKKAPRALGLYVHIPFCRQKCRFCFCDSYVPPGPKAVKSYLGLLKNEINLFKDVFRGVSFTGVYFGGGSPSFLKAAALEDLFKHIKKGLKIGPDALVTFEAVPSELSEGKLALLARHRVNSLIIGVQSFDPRVIRLMGRPQDKKEFLGIYGKARRLGFRRIQVDLIAGLEGQSLKSFLSDLTALMDLRVDYINVTGFAPLEHTPFSRSGKKLSPAQERTRAIMVSRSREILDPYHYAVRREAAASCSCGADDPCVDLRKDTSSLLGIGYSAQSHAFGRAWYQHPFLLMMEEKPDYGELPPFYGIRGSPDEEMRKFMFDNLKKTFSRRLFSGLFKKDIMDAFPREMKEMVRRGLLKVEKESVISCIKERQDFLLFSKLFYSPERIRTLFLAHRTSFRKGKDYKKELERICPRGDGRPTA